MAYLTFKSSFLFIQRDWDLCFPVIRQFVEAVAADRFVGVLGAQHHLLLVAGETVRMVGEVAAAHADGVLVFGRCYYLLYFYRCETRGCDIGRKYLVDAVVYLVLLYNGWFRLCGRGISRPVYWG